MKKMIMFLCIGALCISAGCIFDDDDDTEGDVLTIDELTIGGGVFLIEDLGYGIAEIGVFDRITPYNAADVYVNDVKLTASAGIYTNTSQIPIAQLTTGETVKIAVHALGDSVVKEIVIPEKPVIVKPAEGFTASIEDSLDVEIEYPGGHQLIAMTLSEQDQVAFGAESTENNLKIIIPHEKLIRTGSSILTAYSANTSGEIPDNFEIENQFDVFLVASIALRTIEFEE